MSKKSKITVKGSTVFIEKEGKITTKDVEDYILELNANTEKLRAVLFRNRIIEALVGLAIMFLALFQSAILYAVGGGTGGIFWFLSADPGIVGLIIGLIALALVVHAALFRPSPQLE